MTAKKRLFSHLGISLWVGAVVFSLLPVWPHIYYRLSPQTSDALASTIASTVIQDRNTTNKPSQNGIWPTLKPTDKPTPNPTPTPAITIPDIDPSLPNENGLIIEKIGVRGEIHEGDDWQNILKKGIWRVPNFSTPENPYQPIILAAHRWGYLDWSAAFRKLNSFYHLPELKSGDEVQINWNQRKFVYKIYSTETNTQITDYSANLILYTCQLWNSPVRFFVYANLVK